MTALCRACLAGNAFLRRATLWGTVPSSGRKIARCLLAMLSAARISNRSWQWRGRSPNCTGRLPITRRTGRARANRSKNSLRWRRESSRRGTDCPCPVVICLPSSTRWPRISTRSRFRHVKVRKHSRFQSPRRYSVCLLFSPRYSLLRKFRFGFTESVLVLSLAVAAHVLAQAPPAAPQAGVRGAGRGRAPGPPLIRNALPPIPPWSSAAKHLRRAVRLLSRSDARGGEGGPNLIRSEMVLNDQNGELIAPVVQNGRERHAEVRSDRGAGLRHRRLSSTASASAATTSSRMTSAEHPGRRRQGRRSVLQIQVRVVPFGHRRPEGHRRQSSPTASTLQQTWLMPGGGGRRWRRAAPVNVPPTTVTVTLASGQKVEGRLVRIDDFIVDAD